MIIAGTSSSKSEAIIERDSSNLWMNILPYNDIL